MIYYLSSLQKIEGCLIQKCKILSKIVVKINSDFSKHVIQKSESEPAGDFLSDNNN